MVDQKWLNINCNGIGQLFEKPEHLFVTRIIKAHLPMVMFIKLYTYI